MYMYVNVYQIRKGHNHICNREYTVLVRFVESRGKAWESGQSKEVLDHFIKATIAIVARLDTFHPVSTHYSLMALNMYVNLR